MREIPSDRKQSKNKKKKSKPKAKEEQRDICQPSISQFLKETDEERLEGNTSAKKQNS